MKLFLTSCIILASLIFGCFSTVSAFPVFQWNTTIQTIEASATIQSIEAPTYGTGKIVVEYFRDYQCPACRIFTLSYVPLFERLVQEGKITLIYRQYPLVELHKNSYRDALAALCAAEQGEYPKYSQKIYSLEYRLSGRDVSDTQRIGLLNGTKMNKKQFRTCLTSDRYASRIDIDTEKWTVYGITGIPAIVVNGKLLEYSKSNSAESLETAILQ